MNVRELREKKNLSQQELADKTGIPKDRIAKWEQGKGTPKAEDSKILAKFFMEFVPHEIEPTVEQHDFSMAALINLTQSNKMLAESNFSLARSHEELVHMVKTSTTGSGGGHTTLSVSASFAALLGVLAEIGSGNLKWKSKQEALAALHKFVPLPEDDKLRVGTHADSGK